MLHLGVIELEEDKRVQEYSVIISQCILIQKNEVGHKHYIHYLTEKMADWAQIGHFHLGVYSLLWPAV